MANRPKESLSGIVGVLGELSSARQLSKIQTGFAQASSEISKRASDTQIAINQVGSEISKQSKLVREQTGLITYGLGSLIELQVDTMAELSKVHNSINALELELSKVTNILERQELREQKVGDLKLIIMEIEESLDFIDTLKDEFTPWAAFQTRVLSDMIEDRRIVISDFKLLPPTEIKYVKSILNRVESTHRECLSIMEGEK